MIDFKFIAIEDVYPHESISIERSKLISKSIEVDKQIRHPIVALKVNNRYVILDGHHRYSALKMLKVKFIPLQIVRPQDFSIGYWYHAFENNEIKFEKERAEKANTYVGRGLNNSEEFRLYSTEEDLFRVLWESYNLYKNTSYSQIHNVNSETQWVIYDGIDIDKIILWSIKQKLIPPKVTRFLIENRILNLNIPIKHLFNLDNFVLKEFKDKISNGRFYNESIVYIE